jgi:hypothetical protein
MLAGTLVATPGAAPAAQDGSFTHTIEPWDLENVPEGDPAFDLTAACVREVRGGLEAVFGYENPSGPSVFVPLDPDTIHDDNANVIVTVFKAGPFRGMHIEDLGPQVTLFKPGSHPHAFALRFKRSDRVSWQVRVPSEDEDEAAAWRITVTPRKRVDCGANVPHRYAVLQDVEVTADFANIDEDPATGHITGYGIAFGARNDRTACSAGGEPVAPEVVVGWPKGINLKPIVPDYEVEIVLTGGTVVYEMSTTKERQVDRLLDPVEWLGPIADVTAQCAFGDEIVAGDPFWGERAGGGRTIPEVVDGALVGLGFTQFSPVGSRLR